MAKTLISCPEIIGVHPVYTSPLGRHLTANDGVTQSGVAHRALTEVAGLRDGFVKEVRGMLVRHHVSSEAVQREKDRLDAMTRLGFGAQQAKMKRFPTADKTRKGNLAEVLLAEYLVSSTGSQLPVYRLRYNPNIEQSMKGDDVLAFDLDSNPVRILVGEAKYRAKSTKAVVTGIVEALVKSNRAGIPVSLQFVADRLFEQGNAELGAKVLNCATLFALDNLRLDYVGLVMSDLKTSEQVATHTSAEIRRLAVISFGIDAPDGFITPCYNGLEDEL
ncbi:MAG TPA: Hachiman antiphage defense system protein HamA [Chthoniobacteraceae bacterium]|jgi:hypothetical protein|nr:Hachiman antiphage defense system protein HamA [Chthoniobacteraceae bacterium]